MKLYDVYAVFHWDARVVDDFELYATDSAMIEAVQKLMKEDGDDWHFYYDSSRQMLEEIEKRLEEIDCWHFGKVCVKNKLITY